MGGGDHPGRDERSGLGDDLRYRLMRATSTVCRY
jgi:hypothetical protein